MIKYLWDRRWWILANFIVGVACHQSILWGLGQAGGWLLLTGWIDWAANRRNQ